MRILRGNAIVLTLIASFLIVVSGSALASFNYRNLEGRWVFNIEYKTGSEPKTVIRLCGTNENFANQTQQDRGEIILSQSAEREKYGYWARAEFLTASKVEIVGNKVVTTVIADRTELVELYFTDYGIKKNRDELDDSGKKQL